MSSLLDIASIFFILLLIICFSCKSKLKLFIVIVTLVYYLVGSGALGKIIISNNNYSTKIEVCKNTSAIIVLGAGTNNKEPSLNAYDRILKAAEVYDNYPQKIIISGGYTSSSNKSEAQIYAKDFKRLGVNKNDLILENNSKDTAENAMFIKHIVANNSRSLCLITDGLHLQRSKIYFEKNNINTIALASSIPSPELRVLPSSYNIYTTQRIIHEYFGMVKAYIQTHI
ncbi:YdcF family protein [Francisella adeliensis]|uniref:YdcF family protein n=1 Tax=Francisella adeliensis TaxID=2007306 RepID=A0A2Z4XY47_9GAMM|nr:YdcF family protein [Francisella adeliensis]AXA33811.1 hypothetical protein CDH04_04995 [Francisella adeliensis]MBK2085710.1 YdcF family protein [Francisella adeliensis]MBK2097588.1 YdcF family protein [Francisella adeliensis]QIW12046.1 YdcF family protein [Francisella adeliensis]QIW13921.1 YdcF family protein [Francisella adeliensis]